MNEYTLIWGREHVDVILESWKDIYIFKELLSSSMIQLKELGSLLIVSVFNSSKLESFGLQNLRASNFKTWGLESFSFPVLLNLTTWELRLSILQNLITLIFRVWGLESLGLPVLQNLKAWELRSSELESFSFQFFQPS